MLVGASKGWLIALGYRNALSCKTICWNTTGNVLSPSALGTSKPRSRSGGQLNFGNSYLEHFDTVGRSWLKLRALPTWKALPATAQFKVLQGGLLLPKENNGRLLKVVIKVTKFVFYLQGDWQELFRIRGIGKEGQSGPAAAYAIQYQGRATTATRCKDKIFAKNVPRLPRSSILVQHDVP